MCIFAYGQTGSGKTHTMLGTDIEFAEGRGINFRALEDLFELGRRRQDEASFCAKAHFFASLTRRSTKTVCSPCLQLRTQGLGFRATSLATSMLLS